MQCFSVYDLLVQRTEAMGKSAGDMFNFFREKKIKQSEIIALQQISFFLVDSHVKSAICEFLGMSELEISLSLGHIPPEYRKSFFENIHGIAELLSEENRATTLPVMPFFENEQGKLFNEDCLKVLRSLPKNSVDLVFADPPFNLGKSYDPGISDNLSISAYLNWTYEWLDECIRILKPGGRIFVYNLPKWCVYIAAHLNEHLTFWDWIAVDMKFSLPIQNRLYPAHYALVSYVKGERASTFNNQRIPMQICRHCGGEIKDYGGYKSKMNPIGINVSDVWSDIYPVRHKNCKTRKYNELSVKLLDRVISMSTNEGDVVFDPFGGSGTTFAVAQLLKRRWIGCELGDCEIIKQRILNPEQDQAQLNKIYQEKNHLFTEESKKIRLENGFWLLEEIV